MPHKINVKFRFAAAACLALSLLSALTWFAPAASRSVASAQTGGAIFVRKVSLKANDVVYSPSTNMLYASVPSSAGAGGNSIAPINPATGEVATTVFVGSEPGLLAVSDDGNTMYVSLEGAASLRRFNLQTQTAELEFPVGYDSFYGPYSINDMAVAPGEPGTVAVARLNPGISPPEAGVAIFDNGVRRPKTGAGHISGSDYVAYSASASKLYGGGFYDGLRTMTIDATGVAGTTYAANSVGARIKVAGGLVYGSSGRVMNPDTGALLGSFSGAGSTAFVPDAAAGRVFYISGDSGALNLKAYDVNNFLLLGSQSISGFSGAPTTLVRWGANGLAFTTTAGEVGVIQTSLIPSGSPVPTPTPPPPPATPTPTPADAPTFIRKVNLTADDVVYNQTTQSLYASVPSAAGASGNSIAPVNPSTGAVGATVFVGSEPGRLALADDGRTLYAYLEGASAVRRFDLQTMTPGLQFPVGGDSFHGAYIANDLAVAPGEPNTVAVVRYYRGTSPPEAGVAIFDNGVRRPKTGAGHIAGSDYVAYSASASRLYGGGHYDGLRTMTIDATGVASTSYAGVSVGARIKESGGLIYGSSGKVMNPETGALLGTFGGASSNAFVPDAATGRVFYLTRDFFSSAALTLRAYDTLTFLPVGSQTISGVKGEPTTLIRWGVNGLAFTTSAGELYVIQSALVSEAQPVPTGVGFTAGKLDTSESSNSVTVNVTRTGDLSSPTTVSYATSDGTAAAGSDYTAASGALAFAAGETTKGFSVAFMQDTVYEGAETFQVTLSGPSGGAILTDPVSAVVTIHDNEFPPSISIGDVRVVEGNAGTTEAQFLVSLSNASVQTVSVNYATAAGTASSPGDFNAASGALTIPALTTSATIKVTVNGDLQIEPDETFTVTLSGAVNTSFISRAQATGTIANDDGPGRFQFGAASYSLSEDGGSALITVNRVSGQSGAASVNYASAGGTATAGTDYTPVSGTLNFNEGETSKTFSAPVIADTTNEPSETVVMTLSAPTGGALLGVPTSTTLTIVNDDMPTYQFASTFYEAGEADGQVVLMVTRGGDPNADASVRYTTSDGTATEMSDYNLTLGALRFAPGETQKTLTVLVTNDALGEVDETFLVTLFGQTGGVLGTPSTATVTVHSDEAATGPNPAGDGFDPAFFVRQHYHDFLNREPDQSGLDFWTGEFTQCGADLQCRDVKRVNVSAAFFLSIEFQQTGFLVYRLHQAAYNTQETLDWRTFLADTQEVGRDVQVGVGDWGAKLEANKKAFVDRFAATNAFAFKYQGMSNGQYVDALNANTVDPRAPGLGGALTQAERDQLVADLTQSRKTRAEVLREVAENAEFSRRQSNKAFVLMQYFGYLRRNPNSAPDADFTGYNFWLGKLNEFNGNFIQAEMVKAFLDSVEYKRRFGQ